MPLSCARNALLLALMFATPAFSMDLSRVEWLNRRCGLLVVKSPLGYALAENVGGGMLSVGDTLVGTFNGSSRQTVKNATTQSELSVWVERVFDSKEHAMEKVPEHCRE